MREIAVTRAHGSCSLRVKGSCRNPEPAIRNARRGIQDPRLSLHMLTLYGATYFLSIQPADLECFKSVSTIYRSLFGWFSGNINGLWHGWLVHFVIMPNSRPFAIDFILLVKDLSEWQDHVQSWQTYLSPEHQTGAPNDCKMSVRRCKYCLQFSVSSGRLKISRWPFCSCTILYNKFPTIFWSLIVFNCI